VNKKEAFFIDNLLIGEILLLILALQTMILEESQVTSTPRERCIATLELEEPDRVPLFELGVNLATIERILGRRTVSAPLGRMTSQELCDLARDIVLSYEKAGLDMVPASAGIPENYPEGFLPSRVSENRWKDEFGRIWEDRPGITGLSWYIGGTVKTWEDLNEIKGIDPKMPGRTALAERIIELGRKKDLAVTGYVDGPFLTAYMTTGLETFLVKFYRDRAFAKELLEFSLRFNITLAKKLIESEVDAIVVGEDIADIHGPFINPKEFKASILPYLKMEISEIKRSGIKMILHSDGYTMPVFEDLVKLGIDGYQAIEGDAGMDIGLLKERYGDRLCLLGNVDCGYTLSRASVREVMQETRTVIDKAGHGGGLIMGSSNSIHDGVKFENFLAMIEATKEYGKYYG